MSTKPAQAQSPENPPPKTARGRDAMVAIITAIISATISSFTTFMVQRRSLDEQKQIAKAQIDSVLQQERAKLAAENRKLVVARIEMEKKENQRLARELEGNYYEVQAFNSCSFSPIPIAVRYTDLNGQILVQGWYSISPSRPAITILKTQEKEFSFFVDRSYFNSNLPEHRQLWYGEGNRYMNWQQGQYHKVSSNAIFDYIEDVSQDWQILPQAVDAMFYQVVINLPTKEHVYTISFACP